MVLGSLETKLTIFKYFAAAMIVAVFVFVGATQADAASRRGYEALMVQTPSSAQLTFEPGERTEVTVGFQNIGEKTWVNDGDGYVSIYTYDPKYRRSDFDPGTWLGPSHVKRMTESHVGVGEIGTMKFELHAPAEEGNYSETFYVAAEEVTWIPGGEFTFNITVSSSQIGHPEPVEGSSEISNFEIPTGEEIQARVGDPGYDATVLLRSAKKVTTPGGVGVSYTVGIKNAGEETWGKREIELVSDDSSLVHSSWLNTTLALSSTQGEVKTGQLDFLSFSFTSPRTSGEHLVRFKLTADDHEVEGGEFLIPVDVTSSALGFSEPLIEDGVLNLANKIEEPVMRVGILIVDEETQDKIVVNCDCDTMRLEDENGNPLADVARGVSVTAFYKDAKYYYDAGRGLESSSYALRFVPQTENAVLTISNFDRRATRGSRNADNQFRNVLEMKHSDYKDRVWVINELPIEMYLRGLAETSNVSHIEYQKAIITAARTYAYYHWQYGSKHAREGYMVDAYVDQVYKGYGQEVRMPKLVQAIDETYGVSVTYEGQTAITPYFSRSAGQTYSWADVWAGGKDWLQGVSVPCDAGKTLWGHGVGMSASGALCQANDGMKYQDILKYYYTGVDLRRDWKKE